MKTLLAAIAGIAMVAASWLFGYFNGFRDSWEITYGAAQDPVERGAHAVLLLEAIRERRLDDLTQAKEIDIDSGIVWWHDLSTSKVKSFLPVLTGTDLVAEREAGIRYLAQYRRANPSPVFASMPAQTQAELKDPSALAVAIARTNAHAKSAIEKVVTEYGK